MRDRESQKESRNKSEEIATRVRMLVRQVLGRVFISSKGVFLVQGIPDFEAFYQSLTAIEQTPSFEAAPDPQELGFSSQNIAFVSKAQLATYQRAFQKWRKIVEQIGQSKLKRKKSDARQNIEKWEQEIADIAEQMEYLHEGLRLQTLGKTLDQWPYVLRRVDQNRVKDIFQSITADCKLNTLWTFYARVVAWIGTPEACQKFLTALKPFMEREKQSDQPKERIHPPEAIAVASAAALCACDGSKAPYPKCLLSPNISLSASITFNALEYSELKAIHVTLFKGCREEGYERLIEAFDLFTEHQWFMLNPSLFKPIRQLLIAGADIRDIEWLKSYNSLLLIPFGQKKISPHPLKIFEETFKAVGSEIPLAQMKSLVEDMAYANPERMLYVESFNRWLKFLNPKQMTPSFIQSVWNTAFGVFRFAGIDDCQRDFLKSWSTPPQTTQPVMACSDDLSLEARKWLNQIAYYQRLAGEKNSWPKSIKKFIQAANQEEKEKNFLEGLARENKLDEKQHRRLQWLKSRPEYNRHKTENKIIRQAQKNCAITALYAIQRHMQKEVERFLQQWPEIKSPDSFSNDQLMEIYCWTKEFGHKKRTYLNILKEASQKGGYRYREHIPDNMDWIERARQYGIDLNAWFYPPLQKNVSSQREMQISVAGHPFSVFLMGSYFDTCLSLDEGMNRDSVLANACEANKAVLLIRGSQGEILGRKLVCLNENFKMIGFKTYFSGEFNLWNEVNQWVAAYCGQWARSAKVKLGNFGKPEKLTSLYWYHDGIERWPATASVDIHAPNQETDNDIDTLVDPQIFKVLKERANSCQKWLNDFDLWPLSDLESDPLDEQDPVKVLALKPALAEEILAWIAQNERDETLADLIYTFGSSESGRLDALTTLTFIRKEPLIDEWITHLDENPNMALRAARMLMALDTTRSYECLFKLCYEKISDLWVGLAMTQSLRASETFQSMIMRGQANKISKNPIMILTLIYLLRSKTQIPLSDALIRKLIDPERDRKWNLVMAQWLPPFSQPQQMLSVAYLEKLYGSIFCPKFERLTAILMALKNPCAVSIRFLKEHAREDPLALLALALQAPQRFAPLIEQTVKTMSEADPALMIALLASRSEEDAKKFWVTHKGALSSDLELMEALATLFYVCESRHFSDVKSLLSPLSYPDRVSCYPLIMWGLWQHLFKDVPSGELPRFGAMDQDENCYWEGWMIPLVGHLRDANAEQAFAVLKTIYHVWPKEECRYCERFHASVCNSMLWLFNQISGNLILSHPKSPFLNHLNALPKMLEMQNDTDGAYEQLLVFKNDSKPYHAEQFTFIFDSPDIWWMIPPLLPHSVESAKKLVKFWVDHSHKYPCVKTWRPKSDLQLRLLEQYFKLK